MMIAKLLHFSKLVIQGQYNIEFCEYYMKVIMSGAVNKSLIQLTNSLIPPEMRNQASSYYVNDYSYIGKETY